MTENPEIVVTTTQLCANVVFDRFTNKGGDVCRLR
jgi:hypothetical protein